MKMGLIFEHPDFVRFLLKEAVIGSLPTRYRKRSIERENLIVAKSGGLMRELSSPDELTNGMAIRRQDAAGNFLYGIVAKADEKDAGRVIAFKGVHVVSDKERRAFIGPVYDTDTCIHLCNDFPGPVFYGDIPNDLEEFKKCTYFQVNHRFLRPLPEQFDYRMYYVSKCNIRTPFTFREILRLRQLIGED